MATLYLDRKELRLELKDGALGLYLEGVLERRIPMTLVDRLVVSGDIDVPARLIAALGTAGVGMVFWNPRTRACAAVCGAPGGDARRRLGQAQMALDEDLRRDWARRWARAKLLAQARLLRIEAENRVDARMALRAFAGRIEGGAERLRARGASVESVRGIEGAAAAAYFDGVARLVAPALGFRGRNRRPPKDPLNAALSLIYTLVYSGGIEACVHAGLDPAIGYLHDPAPGRAGLACDLMEPLRPRADEVVIRMFRERTLRLEHFHDRDGACLLGKAGRRAFYEAVEEEMHRMRRQLVRLARVVARVSDAAGGAPVAVPPEGEQDESTVG